MEVAVIVDKNITKEALESLMSKVMIERSKGMEISVDTMKKNKKFQKEQLAAEGYSEIVEIFAD